MLRSNLFIADADKPTLREMMSAKQAICVNDKVVNTLMRYQNSDLWFVSQARTNFNGDQKGKVSKQFLSESTKQIEQLYGCKQ